MKMKIPFIHQAIDRRNVSNRYMGKIIIMKSNVLSKIGNGYFSPFWKMTNDRNLFLLFSRFALNNKQNVCSKSWHENHVMIERRKNHQS